MALGMTSEELMAAFLLCLAREEDLYDSRLAGMQRGENPEFAETIDFMCKKYPNIPTDLIGLIYHSAFAVLETIALNNERISLSIPSSGSY